MLIYLQEASDTYDSTSADQSKFFAVKTYQLLAIFAEQNDSLENTVRAILRPFGYEPRESPTLALSSLFHIDTVIMKFSVILKKEMRSWVIRVVNVSTCVKCLLILLLKIMISFTLNE